MTKNIGIVLGLYAAIAFVVFLYQLVVKLEEGLVAGDAFSTSIGAGVTWPVSLVAMLF